MPRRFDDSHTKQIGVRVHEHDLRAHRLHHYIVDRHWNGRAVVGPDCGIRINYRIGRFVKSYLRFVPWKDSYYYLQAQAYWMLANWRLFERTRDESVRQIAMRTADETLTRRRDDAAWDYPNPEWGGRIASVEGTWAALGLLESYRQTNEPRYLEGATDWHGYLETVMGYIPAPGGSAAKYFANRAEAEAVPNISAFVLRFLAELAAAGTSVDQRRCTEMLSFLRAVQLPSGELPYEVATGPGGRTRVHFQCYQYNAFECIDLLAYHDVTGDERALEITRGICGFLQDGVAEDGHVYYDCRHSRRTVVYHTAAVAAALSMATATGVCDATQAATRAYAWIAAQQRPDGGFAFSYHDYGLLTDRRSYPRNLSMILLHLLYGSHIRQAAP